MFLVTGGAGFIGSHVAYLLKAHGDVVTLDSYQVYKNPIEPWHIENLHYRQQLSDGIIAIRCSTLDTIGLRDVMEEYNPKIIVHLAALPIANLAERSPAEAFENIVVGTHNLLEAAAHVDSVDLIVYISSSMAYGSFATIPVREIDQMRPIGAYGGAKLAGEVLVRSYAAKANYNYIIIRPSAVYGPGDNNCRVVQLFLQRAFQGKSITVYEGTDMVMDFTFVEDAAYGISLATTSSAAEWNTTYNITRGQGRSLWDLVKIIKSEHFPNLQVETKPDPKSWRPRRGALNISKARTKLRYNPEYGLECGVERYVRYMKEYNPSLVGGE